MNGAEFDQTHATTLDQIANTVREVLVDDAIELRLDSRPREIAGWDSLANVSTVFSVEESLGVRLGTGALVSVQTVGDLVSAVERARCPGTAVGELP